MTDSAWVHFSWDLAMMQLIIEKNKQLKIHTSVTPLKRKNSGLDLANPINVRYSKGSGFKRFTFNVFRAAQMYPSICSCWPIDAASKTLLSKSTGFTKTEMIEDVSTVQRAIEQNQAYSETWNKNSIANIQNCNINPSVKSQVRCENSVW